MATFSARFRIMGADLDPEAISSRLNFKPDQSHRRGDPNYGKSGRRYSDFSEGLWSVKSNLPDTDPLDDHLAFLIDKLRGRASVLNELQQQGYRTDVYVGAFGEETGNLGFSISNASLRALGDLGLKLELDVYD
jgi:hypothetical protein